MFHTWAFKTKRS